MNIKKFARVQKGKKVFYVLINGKKAYEIKGSIFEKFKIRERHYPLSGLKILAPVEPSKIVAVGLNYKDHAKELKMKIPEEPIIFLKPPSAVIGPEEKIIFPKQSKEVHYEAELAVIIKKRAKNIPTQKAINYILGYTCANDVTARDLQRRDGQWTRAKSFDTFCPIGPLIVSGINSNNLKIKLKVNGKIKQNSSTRQMIFKIPELISFVSQVMTLNPGDLVLTGTPPRVGPVKKGDIVEVVIEKIGCLRNLVE